MTPRAQLIVILMAVEIAILGGIVIAIRGDAGMPWFAMTSDAPAGPTVSGQVPEGGAQQNFAVGPRPAVTVNIGYADLTIATGNSGRIGVSASSSTAFGPLRAKAPITAKAVGSTVHVDVGDDPGWVIGDNRRVTIVVPPDTEVTVLNAGDIHASGLRATANFKSNNGDIQIDDYNAPRLNVQATRNGDVTLNAVVATRIDVLASNGDVEGNQLQIRDGRIASHDGSIKLGFAPGTDALVTAQAGGRVRVAGFPTSASVAPHVTTAAEGSNDDASLRTVRVGDGSGRIDVHSGSDDIDITQEG